MIYFATELDFVFFPPIRSIYAQYEFDLWFIWNSLELSINFGTKTSEVDVRWGEKELGFESRGLLALLFENPNFSKRDENSLLNLIY